jgi:rhamnogalacturonyl hydrolase YesR
MKNVSEENVVTLYLTSSFQSRTVQGMKETTYADSTFYYFSIHAIATF